MLGKKGNEPEIKIRGWKKTSEADQKKKWEDHPVKKSCASAVSWVFVGPDWSYLGVNDVEPREHGGCALSSSCFALGVRCSCAAAPANVDGAHFFQ